MAAVILLVIAGFYVNFSQNNSFLSANTYEKYNVSKQYRIARHVDKKCFIPNCRYPIQLIGKITELLNKLDAFCFNYQDVDCLYTLLTYRFSGKIVVKGGKLFDNDQEAVRFNHQNSGVDGEPSIAKKRLLRKNTKNFC